MIICKRPVHHDNHLHLVLVDVCCLSLFVICCCFWLVFCDCLSFVVVCCLLFFVDCPCLSLVVNDHPEGPVPLQMIIWMDWPLANDHPDEPASRK